MSTGVWCVGVGSDWETDLVFEDFTDKVFRDFIDKVFEGFTD